MKIYVLRHGETVLNSKGVLQGQSNSELNENGVKLAELTGEALSDIKFDVCFSSPLIRAYKTAELILSKNKHDVPDIITDKRIIEMSFGRWEGKGFTDKNFELPERFKMFYVDMFKFENDEEGESTEDILNRTRDFFLEVVNNKEYLDKNILVVCHGVAMRALLNNVYEDKMDFWHGGVPHNLALNIIEVNDGDIKLIGEDLIFYDQSKINNLFKK
ncbi:MAG: histidine phosphatase family protein [Erysipelotrichaceae bacterium]|nr:histidine phosphatase family protein [Erysipelotrichaceae bacterium]